MRTPLVKVVDMTKARAVPGLLKRINEREVLETIRAGAPISRAEISRRAGISKPTVSLALQSLLQAELVREAARGPDGPGYGALYFEPVPAAALVLGLDLGARFVRGAICDLAGTVRARQDVELGVADAAGAVQAAARLRTALLEAMALEPGLVDGAVVGVPGVVASDSGLLRLADNVAGLEGRPFADELQRALGLPVTLENDINLAALGEQWQGVARAVDDFVFISVGTGMGAGLVLGGELHRGRHGAAGEIDFALAGVGENVDPSAPEVQALAGRLATDGRETGLAPPYDTRAIFDAARNGDRVASEVVDEVARRIALHVAPIAAVADVELVVLGGGIGANGDLLLDPVGRLLEDWLPFPPRVEVSTLGEAAVLTGALAVGLQAALDNVFTRRASLSA
jgi:predicted NBD/HSP70 family sugar kinase/DNA-binding CsgD family transcriptional regulator